MKKIVLIIFLLMNACFDAHADLAGREYNRRIITVEKMLDGIQPFDENYVTTQLHHLRANTTSPDRVRRIERAYVRLGQRNSNRNIISSAKPAVRGDNAAFNQAALQREIETLLLYAESLVATADVAHAVDQKKNAEDALTQANFTIQSIQAMFATQNQINAAFSARIKVRIGLLNDRIKILQR